MWHIIHLMKKRIWSEVAVLKNTFLTFPSLSLSLSSCQYESLITPGNEAIVHHMEVFECSPETRDVPEYSGSCDDKMKPGKLNFCRHVLAAWAMGAEV